MAHVEDRKNDTYIYVISGLFCISILAGGVFLTLFITLQETSTTIWFAIIGMVLVGIPWVFWFLICMYRCCTYPVPVNEKCLSNRKNAPPIAQPVSAATTSGGMATGKSDSPVDSPGGRHVRFGAATVVGGGHDSNSEDMDGAVDTESDISHDGQEGYQGTEILSSATFSNGSRESEQPLTFSISS
ncbi:uncharacterized protein LOC122644713 [Telopea speciosissima]|uniref:uncharacterized protein LOC122644713 n=1 Tax=Telopea speciosissima TaxID=54955 RepID=UPI001CC49E12|nr:uncharacterized protein LOC122644713 [Telopea speciosissima]